MVNKSRKDIINKDLDGYLEDIKANEDSPSPKPMTTKKPSHDDTEYVDISEAGVMDYEDDDIPEKRSFFSQFLDLFSFSKTKGEVEEDVEELKEEYDQEYVELEHEEEKIEQEHDDIERRKTGLIRSFLMRLNFLRKDHPEGFDGEDESEEYEEVTSKDRLEEIRADMKELGKLSVYFLNRLPPPHMKKIKDSDELVRFKALLKKHNLVKESRT
ncbi:MAG: hypothetical protein ABIC95_07440 [archaeon]